MAQKTIGQKFRGLCLSIPFAIGSCGIGILAYQSYFWLTQGYWKPLRASLVLGQVLPTRFFHWLHSADSSLALKRIASSVFNSPLAVFLLVFGLAFLMLMAKIFSLFSKSAVKKEQTKQWRGS